jgi:metallophosphoesterase (TIGR00282 family)
MRAKMNILFIGDVFCEVGRIMLREYLPKLKKHYEIDFTIVNGENVTHGRGINFKHYNQLLDYGIDCITLGNHTFSQSDIVNWIDNADYLVRPANLPRLSPGKGTRVYNCKNKTVQVTNALGRVYYPGIVNHPVEVLEDIVEASTADIHIIDFHADATAEKICIGYEFDGKVSAVLGSHTHVQTADERLLDNGTAYITDAGMCGPYNQSIGMDKTNVVAKMKSGLPMKFEVGDMPGILCGVVVKIDDNTNKPTAIERVNLSPLNDYNI